MKAVVGGKHDDGAVPQTKPIQFVKDAADLRVHLGRGAVAAQLRPQVVRHEKQHIGLVTG